MTFLCSQCGAPVKLGDRVCPNQNCREPQNIGAVFRRLLERIGIGFRRATAVRCPACDEVGSLQIGYCMRCGCNFTVAAVIAPMLRGPRKFWDRLTNKPDEATKRKFQRYYFWFSVALFIGVLYASEKLQPERWLSTFLVAVVFLPLLALLVFWLRPLRKLNAPAPRPVARIIKLSLFCNYFTFLLLLELAVGAWLQQAIIIAVQCAVSVVAFIMFAFVFWPVWTAMGIYFRPQTAQPHFDPTSYQGRRARSDYGGRRN